MLRKNAREFQRPHLHWEYNHLGGKRALKSSPTVNLNLTLPSTLNYELDSRILLKFLYYSTRELSGLEVIARIMTMTVYTPTTLPLSVT